MVCGYFIILGFNKFENFFYTFKVLICFVVDISMPIEICFYNYFVIKFY